MAHRATSISLSVVIDAGPRTSPARTAFLANPLFCFRAISSNRQRAGEFEKAAPQGRIVDPIIGADEFYRLAPPQGIGIKGFGGGLGKTRGNRRGSYRVHVIEEE